MRGHYDCRIAGQVLGSIGYRFIADELSARGIPRAEQCRALVPSSTWLTFDATAPDWTWLTTEHPTAEGKLCLRAVNDVYSNCIAGCQRRSNFDPLAAASALRNTLGVDRGVDREATKIQCNQRFRRYPSCCLCR